MSWLQGWFPKVFIHVTLFSFSWSLLKYFKSIIDLHSVQSFYKFVLIRWFVPACFTYFAASYLPVRKILSHLSDKIFFLCFNQWLEEKENKLTIGALISQELEPKVAVAIMIEGQKHAIAVGIMQMSTADIRSAKKGLAIRVIHFLGDGLYNVLQKV